MPRKKTIQGVDQVDQGAGQLDQEQGAGQDANQFAALDAIGAEAALGEQSLEQQQQQASEPPNPMAGAAGWAMIAHGIGGIVAVALPEVRAAYTEEACMTWGVAMDALSQKYGWEGGVNRFGPEIAVIMATAPLLLPVVGAVKARKEAEAKKVEAIAAHGAEPMKDGGAVGVLP